MTENPEQTPASQEGAENQAEPSMEEILASIRRIISEDEEAEGKKPAEPAEAAEPPEAPVGEGEAATEAELPPSVEAEAAETAADETEEAAGEPEAAKAKPVLAAPKAGTAAVPADEEGEGVEENVADDDDDVLELTRMVTDDGSVVDLAEGKEPEAEMTTDTGEQQEETPEEAEQDTAMADENELTLQDGGQGEPQPAASEGGGTLVSPPVEAATTGSFEQLAKAVTKGDKPGTLLGSASDKTLEDIVKELLRPMLREWLDQNLPSITEKLVRKEIERAARRAEEL